MVTLTEFAARNIRRLAEEKHGGAPARLRIRVVGGGCSGLRYELQFDRHQSELDLETEQHGVRLVIDEKSALYLQGATLDYLDGLNQSGFQIDNPNASSTCGCGESFGA